MSKEIPILEKSVTFSREGVSYFCAWNLRCIQNETWDYTDVDSSECWFGSRLYDMGLVVISQRPKQNEPCLDTRKTV